MDDLEAKQDRVLRGALEYRKELTAYARALLGNHATAEDAVQEAMLVVVKKFDAFQEGTSLLAWCRSIVRLEVLRIKQKRQRELTLADRLLDDAIDAAFTEFQMARRREDVETWRVALECCLNALPQRGRKLLHARFVEEMRYDQIGVSLGMTLEAVRKGLFRLKKQLRTCVETRMKGSQ